MDLLSRIYVRIGVFDPQRQNIRLWTNRWEMLFRKALPMEIVLNRLHIMRFGNATQTVHLNKRGNIKPFFFFEIQQQIK